MKKIGIQLAEARQILKEIGDELRPALSIITPVYNAEKQIKACLKNVIDQGCLAAIEHIICDGGSYDKSIEIVKEYANKYAHIRFISLPGAGDGRLLNEAIKFARGRIIGVLNVKDSYCRGILKTVIEDFKDFSEGSLVVGNLRILNEHNGLTDVHRYDNLNFNDVVWGRMNFPWSSSAYFYHKSLHETAGYYDEDGESNIDLDFVLRALRSAHVFYQDQDMGNWQSLPKSSSSRVYKNGETKEDVKEVLKRYRSDEIPQFPQILPGTLWGISTFFNPVGYKNRYKNYEKFRKASRRQGLKLLVVELVFGDTPFELAQEDADILIQLRGNEENILWQKEALLNLALEGLPEDCDKVAWVDCDILFKNDDWIADTCRFLEKYKVVQPFSWMIHLTDGQDDVDHLKVTLGCDDNKQFYGMAYCVAECGHKVIKDNYYENGHVGLAWAARRKVLEKIGFYDRTPCHNGDTLMARMFFGSSITMKLLPLKLKLDYEEWGKTVKAEVAGSIYYTQGFVMHLWHGSQRDRGYVTMFIKILQEHDFDPKMDIRKNGEGIWEWASEKKVLKEKIREYFHIRKEDGYKV